MGNRWEELAQLDPLFVVLAEKEHAQGGWETGAFFATGKTEIAGVFERLAALGVPAPRGTALDFGCGVGRLTQALADGVGHAVGVDVSPRMLELAREFAGGRGDLEFVLNAAPDLEVLGARRFDLVYTSKVLFHLKPRLQRRYLAELYRVLAPGGILVFGASVYAPAPSAWRAFHARYKTVRRRVLHRQALYYLLRGVGVSGKWLYERHGLRPMMPMYTVAERKIQRLVDELGGRTLAVDREPRRHRMNAIWTVARPAGPAA
jgi:SAM-dependent methyltransferase